MNSNKNAFKAFVIIDKGFEPYSPPLKAILKHELNLFKQFSTGNVELFTLLHIFYVG